MTAFLIPAKEPNLQADASHSAPALSEVEGPEREIDQLVALRQLYGLTEEGDRPRI